MRAFASKSGTTAAARRGLELAPPAAQPGTHLCAPNAQLPRNSLPIAIGEEQRPHPSPLRGRRGGRSVEGGAVACSSGRWHAGRGEGPCPLLPVVSAPRVRPLRPRRGRGEAVRPSGSLAIGEEQRGE